MIVRVSRILWPTMRSGSGDAREHFRLVDIVYFHHEGSATSFYAYKIDVFLVATQNGELFEIFRQPCHWQSLRSCSLDVKPDLFLSHENSHQESVILASG